MEDKTSFDLNSEIRRWRWDLNQSAALAADNLDELESHLLDSVRELQSRGLSDEEAFLIARKRLGGSQALANEFSKVRAGQLWIDRTLWIIVGVALFEAFGSLQWSVVLSSTRPLIDPPPFLEVIIWMAPVVVALLTLRAIIRGTGWTPRTLNALARNPLKFSAALFCLGLSTMVFRAVAMSRLTVFPARFAFTLRDTLVWLVLSLMIWGVAQARVRKTAE